MYTARCFLSLQRYAETKTSRIEIHIRFLVMQVPAQSTSKMAKSQPADSIPKSTVFQAAPFAEAETTFVIFREAEGPAPTIGELAALSARAVGDARVVIVGLLVI